MRARVLKVAIAAALVAGAFACQQILGIDGSVVTASHDACGLAVDGGACRGCLASHCCTQAQACAADPSCSRYESCLEACGADYACRATCVANVQAGDSLDVAAMDQCIVAQCESACGVSCGIQGGYAQAGAAQACQDCIAAHACGVGEACGSDLNCEIAEHCAFSCVTDDCRAACANANDAGSARLVALLFGIGSTCLTQCNVGNYWACVGKITWPTPKTPGVNMVVELTVSSNMPQVPLPGLTVKACLAGDYTCTTPAAVGMTDPNGIATLTLPPPAGYGFDGYFDITGNGIVEYLFFLSFPLSEPYAKLATLIFTTSSFQTLTLNHPVDPALGTIAVVAGDCFHVGAPEVMFETDIDAGIERYYRVPYLSDTATATDRSGLVFFLNAPTLTPIAITATPAQLDGGVSSKVSLFAKPGAISFTPADPTP